jgi:hypothetical protein
MQLSPMGMQQQVRQQQQAATAPGDYADPEKIRVVVRKRPMNKKVSQPSRLED